MELGVALGLLVLAVIVWGIPLILVISDPIISNKEKAIWVFAIGLASWFAWLLYQFVAPVLPRQRIYDFDNQEAKNNVSPTL
jgi:hypothetical protein